MVIFHGYVSLPEGKPSGAVIEFATFPPFNHNNHPNHHPTIQKSGENPVNPPGWGHIAQISRDARQRGSEGCHLEASATASWKSALVENVVLVKP